MRPGDDGSTGPAAPNAAAITTWLAGQIADLAGAHVDEIDIHEPFTGFGLGSRDAVTLTGDLAEWLGRPVPPTLAFDYPTIEDLARHLAGVAVPDPVPGPADRPVREPIAVIGIGCRFPGADSPDAFWRLLRDGVDAIREVPPDRWNVADHDGPDPTAPGRMSTRWGGFLDQVDLFDAQFFGISPREAASLDPQQRLLLEVSWEALEDAGQAPDRLAGTQTGVFVGISSMDYAQLAGRLSSHAVDVYTSTGNAHSIAANRLSYALDLRGPSVALDTACSSSLVALDLACRSLRDGESQVALAGGVNVILDPAVTVAFSHANMMAADGRCKTFDESGDGYVRGEGAGVVVLKRLSAAQRDGDFIYGVVRGTAVNQDGRTAGLTAPNGAAQQAVVRAALARAGVPADQISLVEAHGTGTVLGDPIEVAALAAVLGTPRSGPEPCWVSSVKTNVGHLEAAAGIAGFIKVLLSLVHETIPAHLHLRRINPLIELAGTRLAVPTAAQPWPRTGRPRVAGVSSFGFGGTNAHVVVEEAPARPSPTGGDSGEVHLLTLSARSELALRELAGRLAAAVAARADITVADVCHSANRGRVRFAHRAATVAATRAELAENLTALADGTATALVRQGRAAPRRRPTTAFLFTGQGSQYPGMGADLYRSEPVFRAAVDRCAEVVRAYQSEPLTAVLFPAAARAGDSAAPIDHTAYAQPALFAIEYALAQLWQSWGVEPDLLLGHSLGEYVAACVAGVFTVEDGLALVCRRARLMGHLAAGGAMAVVFAAAEEVAEEVLRHPGELSVAAVNGPATTVISGLETALDDAVRALAAQGIGSRRLTVSHAFHSPLMRPILADFAEAAGAVRYTPARIPIVLNVTGQAAAGGDLAGPDYWLRQLTSTVRFADGVRTLAARGCDAFIEVGPRPTLLGLARRCLGEDSGLWLPSLRRDGDGRRSILDSAARLFVGGGTVQPAVPAGRTVPLPTTPYQRSRHWLAAARPAVSGPAPDHAPAAPDNALAAPDNALAAPDHGLLGGRVRSAVPTQQWESHLSVQVVPALGDHVVVGSAVLPATGFLSMALAAARDAFGSGHDAALAEVVIRQALFVPDSEPRVVQLVLFPATGGVAEFQIFSQAPAAGVEWTLHANGKVRLAGSRPDLPPWNVDVLRGGCPLEVPVDHFYDGLRERGLAYGPAFRTVTRIWRGSGQALGQVQMVGSDPEDPADPLVLDGCLQVLAAAMPDDPDRGTYLPDAVAELRMYDRLPRRVFSHATLRTAEPDAGAVTGDVRVLDGSGRVLADILGLRLVSTRPAAPQGPDGSGEPAMYEPVWVPAPDAGEQVLPGRPAGSGEPGRWLIFADAGGVGARVAEHLTARGDACTTVRCAPGDSTGGSMTRLDAGDADRLAQLVRTVVEAGQPPLRGIVHLWAADVTAPLDRTDAAEVVAAQRTGVQHLVLLAQALSGVPPVRLWLVTRGVHAIPGIDTGSSVSQAPVWGLGRTLRWEFPELDCRLVDLDVTDTAGRAAATLTGLLLAADAADQARHDASHDAAERGGEQEVAVRGGRRYVRRLRPLAGTAAGPALPAGRYRLEVSRPGQLANLRLRPVARRPPVAGEVEIEVGAAGVNFRDVMNTLGIYPGAPIPLGAECAGRVTAVGAGVTHLAEGDAVVAIAAGTFGTHVTAAADLVVRAPTGLSVEEAATIPIAFLTAHYALAQVARLQRGEQVLIHSAAGGVGLAAVQLAPLAGAEVLATAGSPDKRAYLRDLGVKQVMDSRTLEFADEVMRCTGGRGVDVVLNALPGEYAAKSLAVLAPYGRFVEIGRTDIYLNRPLPLYPFRSNLSYTAVDLDRLCRERTGLARTLLYEILDLFAQGALRPLPSLVVAARDAAAGFRHLAQRRNIGKVVLSFDRGADPPGNGHGPPLRADASYLVTGGLGTLGLSVAGWLVDHGARHLVLVGRQEPTGAALRRVDELRRAGALVTVMSADVARADETRRVVESIRRDLPPLRGVVHAAGIIDDATLRRLEPGVLARVLAPKVYGAWHLHAASRDIPLDFFVLFSSLASVLGSPGQANYAAANAFLDALSHARRAAGLPGVAINWGPWAGAGMAAGNPTHGLLHGRGIEPHGHDAGLRAFGALLDHPPPEVVVARVDWQRLFDRGTGARPPALLTELLPDDQPNPATYPLRAELLRLPDVRERRAALLSHLRQHLGDVLGLAPDAVDPDESLNNVGLDSLMALELKDALESAVGVRLAMEMLLQDPRVTDLVEVVLTGLGDGGPDR